MSRSPDGDASHWPSEFQINLNVGGEYGYWVGMQGRELVYERTTSAGTRHQAKLTPDRTAWDWFWSELDAQHVWDWPEYFEYAVFYTDGMWWSAEITHGTRTLKTHNYNVWPPGGLFDDPTPEWISFAGAVSRLLNGLPFGYCQWTGESVRLVDWR